MKRITLQTSLIILLIVSSLSLTSAVDDLNKVLTNPKTITFSLSKGAVVTGLNCYKENLSQDEFTINIPVKGEYEVYAKALRSGPKQKHEAYHIEINGKAGTVSEDENIVDNTTIDFLGNFNLNQGSQKIIIKTDAKCPPDATANSVHIDTFYIIPITEEPRFIKRSKGGDLIDCPVEYYDPLPKFYNCPIERPQEYYTLYDSPLKSTQSEARYESPVHVASDEVYGDIIEEDTKVLKPFSPYSQVKRTNNTNFSLIILLTNMTFLILVVAILMLLSKE